MLEQYLERLFTWESLENTERGVEFELKNRLTDAEFQGVSTARLDGEAVPLEDVTLELSETERYAADEVSEENPLYLDLAETVQVVGDVERLRLGVHEIEIGLQVEGYGEVGFTTDDEVTEADLIDVDPAEWTVAELESLVEVVTEPRSFERLLERERDGKARKTAIEVLEGGLEDAEPLTEDEMVRTEVTEKESGDGLLDQLLADVLESPQRVSVYLTVQALGSGTPEEVAGRTVFTESTVAETLSGLENEGVAQRTDGDAYRVVSPVAVLQKRTGSLLRVLRGTLRG